MSQMQLKTRINIITTPYSVLYKLVKYIQRGKIFLFFRIGPWYLAPIYFTSVKYISCSQYS